MTKEEAINILRKKVPGRENVNRLIRYLKAEHTTFYDQIKYKCISQSYKDVLTYLESH